MSSQKEICPICGGELTEIFGRFICGDCSAEYERQLSDNGTSLVLKIDDLQEPDDDFRLGGSEECSCPGNIIFDNDNKDYKEAVKWVKKAAEQGVAGAQYNLGDCYYNGNGVEQNYKEAVKWFKRAAEQGHALAQYELGFCYYVGNGVKQDYAEAVKWYQKAAEQGDVKAQYKLGRCYYLGNGVEKDCEEAVKWYKKAAEQEDAFAQRELGDCYYNGNGVERN